jgi:RimJ/RimL family protein N-acetyltransferase
MSLGETLNQAAKRPLPRPTRRLAAAVASDAARLEPSWHRSAAGARRIAIAPELRPDGTLRLSADVDGRLVVEAVLAEATLTIAAPAGLHPGEASLVAMLVEAAFQHRPEAASLVLPGFAGKPAVLGLAVGNLASAADEPASAIVQRSDFFQMPLLWRVAGTHVAYPALGNALAPADRPAPLRPPQPVDVVYERWQPELGMMLSLRSIDRRRDLDQFHEWMNQPRVAHFWELAKPRDELDAYLAAQEADPHLFGVVGSFDDEPVAYFEFYWAKEDRLGPYYEPEDFDRGWHGLVGNPRHLGRAKTGAWFRAVTHYLFLDEPRTRRIMGEPRASHSKMLSYCAETAYDKIKEFDFPHKRAALVCCERARFFREVRL